MQMKEMRMAMGSVRITTRALGRWKRKTMQTTLTAMRELDDLLLEGVDGPLDQVGAVIGGDDLHALGEARLHISA